MPDKRIIGLLVATLIAGSAAAGIAMQGGNHSHHSRQDAVAERGAKVMSFSLDATTHFFEPTATGGVQQVVADDHHDREQIRLIRQHLRHEAGAFRHGDYSDPAMIHGRDMPGLAALEAGAGRMAVTYRDLPDGAAISFQSRDQALVAAVADWFAAQVSDHGADAAMGSHAGHHG